MTTLKLGNENSYCRDERPRYATTMTGKVRIISGLWRGRKIEVLDQPGLRPSGDRSRETLFNWLGPSIQGKRCLDLFAGTGALGLEAVSRGADSAVLIEQSRLAARHIRQQILEWQHSDRVEVIDADGLAWLSGQSTQFDLVFIDPPHGMGLQIKALRKLVDCQALSAESRVCLEAGLNENWIADQEKWLESNFRPVRSASFGQVVVSVFELARYN